VTVALIVSIIFWGLVVGLLARLAVPGPDPMPIWVTIAIGVAGAVIGGIVARIFLGYTGGFIFSFAGAVLLVILYRRFVQGRTMTGPRSRI
jgi:uncharacterized membrane protein YeaQ/YmgE (transglycosylase-associated protein family)